MEVLVRLYNMVDPAADGSIISREVTEEYLRSEDYREVIRDKLAIGGLTHKARLVDGKYKDIVGPDDQILLDKNTLFYIKEIYTKPDSNFCWAVVSIYDPENFSGELRDEIINLRGMLKEGTKLPCSVVISASWGSDNRCLRINRIKGVDFTLNPSFAGSGTNKLMSTRIITDEVRTFSNMTDARAGVRCFSFTSEISPLDFITRGEVIGKFGKSSPEFRTFSQLSQSNEEGKVRKQQLSDALLTLGDSTEDMTLDQFIEALGDIVTPEDREMYVTLFQNGKNTVIRLLKSVPNDDPNYETLVKNKLLQLVKNLPEQDKTFSLASVTWDRMKILSYYRTVRIRLLIRVYQSYWNQYQGKLDASDKRILERLFISDVQLLIKDALPFIKEGGTLSSYYQLMSINPDLSRASSKLSIYYRRLLISTEALDYIPINIYIRWSDSLEVFLDIFVRHVFGGRLGEERLSFIAT